MEHPVLLSVRNVITQAYQLFHINRLRMMVEQENVQYVNRNKWLNNWEYGMKQDLTQFKQVLEFQL
jgi:hypothetical protein